MASSVALVAFESTWTIMVIVAFKTQRLTSAVMFLLPVPCSTSTFITGASSLILSSSRCSTILDYVANLLVISALYSARPIMVKVALIAQRARDAGFLWERVGKVMGSSWSSGGVVRSEEEAVAGLAGENGVKSAGLNVGGRQGTVVGKVMGSSWHSGGVVRSREEAVAGLAGENGVKSAGLNVGEDMVLFGNFT
uniref:Uncharacterized protein n=1 Tax=Tanacetum cinerariifolium TaxID=118510 RepID=A0A6L2L9C7_TANCI|nr:hypothetical protein [Tanacetum cinerariifolium]